MGWFRRLEERLGEFATEVKAAVVTIGHEIATGTRDVIAAGEAAISAVIHEAPEIAEAAVDDTYQKLIGSDLKVLRDPKASIVEKADAAFDLATTFTMPLAKIPAMVAETTLKSLINEGESTAIVAALTSLKTSGDVPALIGVEAALLDNDPAAAKMLQQAGIDPNVATATLAAVKGAIAAGQDLPTSAKSAVADLATALGGPGSFDTRLSSLHSSIAVLEAVTADLGALGTGATAVGKVALPGATASAPAVTPTTAAAHVDVVHETLAKIPPETIERIKRGGRAEVGLPHAEATPWDGKGQIGSVTSVIGSRVEQYVGKGWVTYDAAQLAPLQAQLSANAVSGDPHLATTISPGDELRVGANGSITLVPHDTERTGIRAVSVAPGGASQNLESAGRQGR